MIDSHFHFKNKCDFKRALKMFTDADSFMVRGSSFHSFGPMKPKVLSPVDFCEEFGILSRYCD